MFAAIADAKVSAAERRYLRRVAVEKAAIEGPAKNTEGAPILVLFEETMAVARMSLRAGMGLGTVRRTLLDAGQKDLTKRLDSLAKGRRATAHPDTQLPADLAAALAGLCGPRSRLGRPGRTKFWVCVL